MKNLFELEDFLMRCMAGSRTEEGAPTALNVLTAIQALNKEPVCDKYADFYALLCEFSHPNALGTVYAYSSSNAESYVTQFGHNRGLTNGGDVAFTVVFALEVLLEFQECLTEMMPRVVQLAREAYPDN